MFLATPVDVAVYGGAAGGGKTQGLLFETLRYAANPRYRAVIFRRLTTSIKNPGGLYDASESVYPLAGGRPAGGLEWRFPSGARVKFSHLQRESDKHTWDGAELDLICFDELTEFTESQFWYLFSRARSASGIRTYIRATCNPDASSWVKQLIQWWIDSDGYAIRERSGVVRHFIRDEFDEIQWVDENYRRPDGSRPLSFTFISAQLQDNQALMEADPEYEDKLRMLSRVERERLLKGNWNIRPEHGMFLRTWFEVVEEAPADVNWVRYWDRAATSPSESNRDPDWTSGCLGGHSASTGVFYIRHIERGRTDPVGNERMIRNTAIQDGEQVAIWIEQEPGSSGKDVASHYTRNVLAGANVRFDRVTGSKIDRAKPLSASAEAGNVKLVRGPWVPAFLAEAENFPLPGHKKDQIDSASGCFSRSLELRGGGILIDRIGSQKGRERRSRRRRKGVFSMPI
jgi:predicted phage terminase large subunit-like protein